MKDKVKARDGVPDDYPGRIVGFPPGVEHLVVQLLGIQTSNEDARDAFMTKCGTLCAGTNGPGRIERGEYVDSTGLASTVLMMYWAGRDVAEAWWRSDEVRAWWQGLPMDGDAGYFTERMLIPEARFNYAAGTEDRHGSAAILPLEPSATFGYWGAYRDRLPASKTDSFESPLKAVTIAEKATRGRRLTVTIPDNLCFIREGQGWGKCGPEERKIWDNDMNGVIDTWVARLASDPASTGCLSVRDCLEYEGASGAHVNRRTQLAFLLSLSHIEHAARTDPAHLAVHGAFIKMYTKPKFKPQMHVWVEIGVMKSTEVMTEYVNCHPQTGLLPYFDVADIANG